MVTLFTQIQQISDKLEQDKLQNPELRYHIDIKFNNQLNLFIYTTNTSYEVALEDIIDSSLIDIRYIDNELYQEDEFYRDLFKTKIGGYTRRLANIFNETEKVTTPCPLITFYSYKGGVGRTTTLAFFASHYAKHGKKVIILDCDFEAPGFTNFFNLKTQGNKNGIVEYLYNGGASDLGNYLYDNIGNSYTGVGNIWVMPAGNLSEEPITDDNGEVIVGNIPYFKTHREHYLQALARLDLANPEIIAKQFKQLIDNLYEQYKPDVILLDSRTGFNDIFTNIALRLSKLVIGFFGVSNQTEAGLGHTLEIVKATNTELVLVCPMLPIHAGNRIFRKAIEKIENYIVQNLDKEQDNKGVNYNIFRTLYESELAIIGIDDIEDPTSFEYIIDNNIYPAQNENKTKLFDFLTDKLNALKNSTIDIATPNADLLTLKISILRKLYEYLNKEKSLYGEQTLINETTLAYFYFRNNMQDIFKKDLFLIKGSKGTGKSLLYEALQYPKFANNLVRKTNRGNYVFTNIISNPQDIHTDKKNSKYLQTYGNNLNPVNVGLDGDTYWKRFWIVFTWNAILLDANSINYTRKQEFSATVPLQKINSENALLFEQLLVNGNFETIQKELRVIDNHLQQTKTNLVILYDYLDYLVKPDEWAGGESKISPLFDFWRSNNYNNIMPKIFVRSDLYGRISGVNTNNIDNNAISIEWNVEELFSFFFKLVFLVAEKEFLRYISLFESPQFIEQLNHWINNNECQIPVKEQDVLRKLVSIFFGTFVDTRNEGYGLSYDWFYKNLKNADNTISLRPFIELIKFSIQVALGIQVPTTEKDTDYLQINSVIERKGVDVSDNPILPGNYFANGIIRSLAVKRYFKDIRQEAGNDFLRHLEDTLKNNNQADRFKKSFLYENQLVDLIDLVIKLHTSTITVIDAKELLIANGIIKKNFSQPTSYSFAFLYKYYFALRSR
jgi:MinD-like ATPase involved in chromosome partitioning or flagellar assembly